MPADSSSVSPSEREIEAVARALARLANETAEQVGMDHDYGWEEYEAEAETAIAALSHARDRSNEETAKREAARQAIPPELEAI